MGCTIGKTLYTKNNKKYHKITFKFYFFTPKSFFMIKNRI